MGAETTQVQILDGSLETNKDSNPFLPGVPAILDALRSGQIACRVYDKDKFHAKAYIMHAKLEVVGSNRPADHRSAMRRLARVTAVRMDREYWNSSGAPGPGAPF